MITEAEVLAEAAGSLFAFGKYTEPDPSGEEPQRRIHVEQHFDNGVIVRIEGARYTGEADKRFIVLVAVKELTNGQ